MTAGEMVEMKAELWAFWWAGERAERKVYEKADKMVVMKADEMVVTRVDETAASKAASKVA